MKKLFRKYAVWIAWICGILATIFGAIGLAFDNLGGCLLFLVFIIPGTYAYVLYCKLAGGEVKTE